ncbi:hypothetical protein KQI65_11735 [bacterium]|nr:hypothetical protein [bacterium]
MKRIILLAAVVLIATGCSKQEEEKTDGKAMVKEAMEHPAPAKRDVSDEALIAIDPDIQKYADRLSAAEAAVKEEDNAENQIELIEAHMAYADYMTYESSVSPREGKYHRALIEYKHALELDPDNEKAQVEIAQIEDIYRSMNRPIPGEE